MNLPKLIDAHCHLADHRLAGRIDAVLAKARGVGIGILATCAAHEPEWCPTITLADHTPEIQPFIGIHPWFAGEISAGWEDRLHDILAASRAGIGEIGLDRLHGPPAAIQEAVFLTQLRLALEHKRPVIIHCVRRWGRLLELTEAFDLAAAGWLVHAFGGPVEIMQQLLKRGALLSFPPWLADPGAAKMRAVFRQTPVDRLLLETDSPDNQGSEPAQVAALYSYAAGLKDIVPVDFTAMVWENGRQIFTD